MSGFRPSVLMAVPSKRLFIGRRRSFLPTVIALSLGGLTVGGRASSAAERAPADVTRRFEEEIPSLMRDQRVPGIAAAVVDEQGVVWCRGFGTTGGESPRDVDPDTIFSIQSASKTFTATGVMLAVQEGLVSLDEPITTYLPGFRVNSFFQERPEAKMTLRHLLSHTAGFTHEAPVGNNFDLTDAGFDEHVRSLSETWLRFPVGENYAYSNLGIDLAAHVVEQRAGVPLGRFIEERLFKPLDMRRSTLDVNAILKDRNRAIGHAAYFRQIPVRVPMLAAGGVYASARDVCEFLRFQLDHGRHDDRQVLDSALLEEMIQIPPFAGGHTGGYALGVVHFPKEGPRCLGHSGGGFGFLSDLYWYPDLGLGAVVLTNSTEHSLQQDLIFRLLDGLVNDERTVYNARLRKLPPEFAEAPLPPGHPGKELVESNEKRLASRARAAAAGAELVGDYRLRQWGRPVSTIRIRPANQGLTIDGEKLHESGEGRYMTAGGETLDFGKKPATWRNIPLERIAIPVWQKGLLGVSLLLFFGGLLAWGVQSFRERRRSTGSPAESKPGGSAWRAIARTVAIANAVLCLSLLGGLSFQPAFIGAGMLDATPQTPAFDAVFMRLPVALALLTLVMAAVAIVGRLATNWPASFRQWYTVVAMGAVAFIALLVVWKVLGV